MISMYSEEAVRNFSEMMKLHAHTIATAIVTVVTQVTTVNGSSCHTPWVTNIYFEKNIYK